jgi:hypothetical protein
MGNGASAPSFGGQPPNLGNYDLTNVKSILYDGEYSNGNSGTGTVTLSYENGGVQVLTLTGDCTVALSAPATAARMQVKFVQGGSGSYTITWPTQGTSSGDLAWANKTQITLSTAVGAVDYINFYFDGSVHWAQYGNNFG